MLHPATCFGPQLEGEVLRAIHNLQAFDCSLQLLHTAQSRSYHSWYVQLYISAVCGSGARLSSQFLSILRPALALALALPPPELLEASLLAELDPMFPPKARLPPEVALAAAEPLLLWLLAGVVGV